MSLLINPETTTVEAMQYADALLKQAVDLLDHIPVCIVTHFIEQESLTQRPDRVLLACLCGIGIATALRAHHLRDNP